MKKIYKILLLLNLVFIVSCDKKEKHLTSKDICEKKLPPFIEKFDGQFDKEKLKLLCDCIWNKFPENRWERKSAIKIFKGYDPGWKL